MSDQMGFDIEFDAPARTAWDEWVDLERRTAQVRKFLDRAEVPALPPEPWDFESGEVYQVSDMVRELFPDIETATLPANRDLLDQLVCTIGEWYTRYLDARWCDMSTYAHVPNGYNDTADLSIYHDFKPGIVFKFEGWRSCTAEFLVQFTIEREFWEIAALASVGFWRAHKKNSGSSRTIGDMRESMPDYPPFLNS